MFAADAHCDFLYYMVTKGYDIAAPTPPQAISLPSMREGRVALQFFAAWIDVGMETPCYEQCAQMADAYARMLKKHPHELTPFTKEFSPEEGRTATVLTIENGDALEGCLENLQAFYDMGARAMALTWNAHNALGYPATGFLNRGLTRFGKEVIAEMGRLQMAVDVAHLSDAGIDDALSLAKQPVFASHSNARGAYSNKRSLQDAHLKAIAAGGGVVCVNFYPPQLSGKKQATMDDIVRQIEYILALCGPQSVGIGSDFDGMNQYPLNFSNSAALPRLWERLLRLNYSEKIVRRIAYDNLRDYIAKFY